VKQSSPSPESSRERLRQKRIDKLFEAMEQLAALPLPPLTEAELAQEIEAIRSARRSAAG
jgi:hypothetical protein